MNYTELLITLAIEPRLTSPVVAVSPVAREVSCDQNRICGYRASLSLTEQAGAQSSRGFRTKQQEISSGL